MASSLSNMNSASALASSVLPTPVGPRKMNEPIGRRGILQAAARAADRIRQRDDRLVLADHALVQARLHLDQLLALGFEHAVDRDTGPLADDRRHVFLVHHLVEVGSAPSSSARSRSNCSFEPGGVGLQRRRALVVAPLARHPLPRGAASSARLPALRQRRRASSRYRSAAWPRPRRSGRSPCRAGSGR